MNRRKLYKIFNDKGFKIGAEIGVQAGLNAFNMFKCIPELKLYLIDPWETRKARRYYDVALKNLARYKDDIIIIRKPSLEASLEIPYESLDFVYIDGNHRYNAVMLDIILWSQKVKRGGIISGHDYYTRRVRNFGVKHAVDDYIKYHKIDLKFVGRRNWYWEK